MENVFSSIHVISVLYSQGYFVTKVIVHCSDILGRFMKKETKTTGHIQ